MSTGIKDSQLTTAISIMKGTEYWGVSYYDGSNWVTARLPVSVLSAYLSSALSQSYTETNFAANQDNWINLGAAATYGAVKVTYFAERSSNRQAGEIYVIHDDSNAIVYDGNKQYIPSAPDFEIKQARISGGQIQVNIKTGSTDSNQTAFNYKITEQKPL